MGIFLGINLMLSACIMGAVKREYALPGGITLFSVLLLIITEGMSFFHKIAEQPVAWIWGSCGALQALALGFIIWKKKGRDTAKEKTDRKCSIFSFRQYWFEVITGLFLAGLGMYLLVLAVNIVPNNWDTMTYHLARVANWIQNESVSYYFTNNIRQLYYPPFAEYVALHIILLTKNDIYVNLIQWFAYVSSACILFQITGRLHFHIRTSVAVTALYMLLPLTIAESTTTQVDLVGIMWLLVFLFFTLEAGQAGRRLSDKFSLVMIALCACALGLGYLTKSTVCVIMLFALIWLFIVCVRRKEKAGIMLRYALAAGCIFLLLAGPSFKRNYDSAGDILASGYMSRLMTSTKKPSLLLVNMCKNIATVSAGERTGELLVKMTIRLADMLNVDIEDKEISAYSGFADSVEMSYGQDAATSPWAMLLFFASLAVISVWLLYRLLKRDGFRLAVKDTDQFLAWCLAAALLCFILLRWQPWGSRLLLPSVMVFCIFTGRALELFRSHRALYTGLACMMVLCASVYLNKSLEFPRECAAEWMEGSDRFPLYYKVRGGAWENTCLCEFVEETEVGNIGLYLENDSYEYPLWVKLKNKDTVLRAVSPEQQEVEWYPDCIVALDRDIALGQELEYGERVYRCIWNYEDNTAYAVLAVLP